MYGAVENDHRALRESPQNNCFANKYLPATCGGPTKRMNFMPYLSHFNGTFVVCLP